MPVGGGRGRRCRHLALEVNPIYNWRREEYNAQWGRIRISSAREGRLARLGATPRGGAHDGVYSRGISARRVRRGWVARVVARRVGGFVVFEEDELRGDDGVE